MNKQFIDYYYQTSYTSNTVNGIKKLYKTLDFACKDCKVKRVDSIMEIQDSKEPTFVISRKNFCQSCWLKRINCKE